MGRRFPLTVDQRESGWRLYTAYQQQLQGLRIQDLNDVMMHAAAELRARPLDPGYSLVVVDEVQDLTYVAVQMLHHLVDDRPDGLMLIGDGQQSVYPGGFTLTLTEAGVDVRGRSTVLRHNYRNTAEILATAQHAVAGDAFSDLAHAHVFELAPTSGELTRWRDEVAEALDLLATAQRKSLQPCASREPFEVLRGVRDAHGLWVRDARCAPSGRRPKDQPFRSTPRPTSPLVASRR